MSSVTIKAPADGEYGYIEPNFLSAPRTGQVRADLPADPNISQLTNGQFVKRDTANGIVKINASAPGKWWMVFNEEKLYDERYQDHKHYAMKQDDFTYGSMTPRVIQLLVGDTFTTNNVYTNGSTGVAYAEGSYVDINSATGILEPSTNASWLQVVKAYTMPDGGPGIKIEVVDEQ